MITMQVPFEAAVLIEAAVGLEGHNVVEHACIYKAPHG